MNAPIFVWALFPAALWCAGCGSCDDAHTVPFKRKTTEPAGRDASKDAASATSGLGDAALRQHDGGVSLQLGEQTLQLLDPWASLTVDLNQDGWSEALVWAGGTQTPLSLWYARGRKQGFSAAVQVDQSSLVLAPTCNAGSASFERFSHTRAALRVSPSCETAEPQRADSHFLWLSLSDPPRVLKRLALRDRSGTAPLTVSALTSADVDGDGHEDISLKLRADDLDHELELTWLDRPSGLVRDTSEPEESLAALAQAAQKQLDEDPAGASRTAATVLALHGRLCRELGEASLSIDDVWGLRCGRSSAAGTAVLVAASGLATQGEVLKALHTLESMTPDAARIDARARRQAVRLMETKGLTPEWKLRPVANTALSNRTFSLAPSLRLTGDELWVGTSPPRSWSLPSLTEAPALSVPHYDVTIKDPSRRFRVRHVDRDCEGRKLRIQGPEEATQYARARRTPPPRHCRLRKPVPDAGDLLILGWAPQGVVLSDVQGALLVPLDADAKPTEPPRRIPTEVPLPAPLQPGRAAPSGRCYVRPTSLGILLTFHGRRGGSKLVRPAGWETLDGPVRDVVVGPRCNRIAITTQRRTYVIEREAGGVTKSVVPTP